MGITDVVEGIKIAKEKRIAKEKEKSLQNITDLMATYADNAVNKFKTEYFVQSSKGKRTCKIRFNPYPNAEIMRKVLAKVTKKEYLIAFEKVLADKLEKQGFTDYSISENFLNTKEPITLHVKW